MLLELSPGKLKRGDKLVSNGQVVDQVVGLRDAWELWTQPNFVVIQLPKGKKVMVERVSA